MTVMTNDLKTSPQPLFLKRAGHMEAFVWALCCLPVVYASLLLIVAEGQVGTVRWLCPLSLLGGATLMLYSVRLLPDERRIGAWFYVAAMIFYVTLTILGVYGLSPGSLTAAVLMSLGITCIIIGTSFYFGQYPWWLGNRRRALVGGATVGCASIIAIQSVLTTFGLAGAGIKQSGFYPFIGADIGIMYCLVALALRHEPGHSALVPLFIIALSTEMVADVLYQILIIGDIVSLYQLTFPLYTLAQAIAAVAIYRDATYQPSAPTPQPPRIQTMPFSEWLLWTFTPLAFVIVALVAASMFGKVSSLLLLFLLAVALIHELLAALDYRRVLQNLRSTYSQLQQQAEKEAVMEERHRLARELHDSTTQLLYGQTLMAEAGMQVISRGDWQRSAEYMARLRDVAHEVHRDMRLLLYELRPPVLGENSLMEVLRQRLEGVERRTGVEASLVVEGGRLPAQVEEAFYRVAWEALNNASKYASATSVKVLIRTEDKRVELEVTDNGRGFDLEAASQRGGLGLMTMRERVEKLGGTLTIISSPGQGTQVKAALELNEPMRLAG